MTTKSVILLLVGVFLLNAGKSEGFGLRHHRPSRLLWPHSRDFVDPWRSFHAYNELSPFRDIWQEDLDDLFWPFHRYHLQDYNYADKSQQLRNKDDQSQCGCRTESVSGKQLKADQEHSDTYNRQQNNRAFHQEKEEIFNGKQNPHQEENNDFYMQQQNRVLHRKADKSIRETNMPSRNSMVRNVNLAEIDVTGYAPNELDVQTQEDKIIIKGHHKCACDDSCLVTEFQRVFSLPKGVSSESIRAKFTRDNKLYLTGSSSANQLSSPDNRDVGIDYAEIPRVTKRANENCQSKKAGIHLRKVPAHQLEHSQKELKNTMNKNLNKFEEEKDDDGVTIEVVE